MSLKKCHVLNSKCKKTLWEQENAVYQHFLIFSGHVFKSFLSVVKTHHSVVKGSYIDVLSVVIKVTRKLVACKLCLYCCM